MGIDKIASGAKYRMDEPLQSLRIFGISLIFQIKKNLKFF